MYQIQLEQVQLVPTEILKMGKLLIVMVLNLQVFTFTLEKERWQGMCLKLNG